MDNQELSALALKLALKYLKFKDHTSMNDLDVIVRKFQKYLSHNESLKS